MCGVIKEHVPKGHRDVPLRYSINVAASISLKLKEIQSISTIILNFILNYENLLT